jgi:hypothetical protein
LSFLNPSAPVQQVQQEDPELKRMRDAERRRAEEDRTRATQQQLGQETQLRSQSGGIRSLLGSLGTGRRGLTSLLGSG